MAFTQVVVSPGAAGLSVGLAWTTQTLAAAIASTWSMGAGGNVATKITSFQSA